MDEEEQAKNRQEKCNTLVMEASQNNTRLLTVNTSSPMGEQVRIVKNPVHEKKMDLINRASSIKIALFEEFCGAFILSLFKI